jgi:peptide/nickel transport system permease protein
MSRRLAAILLGLVALAAIAAPVVAPHGAAERFADAPDAPPSRIRLIGADGTWHPPFFHPSRLVSRLEGRYEEDRTRMVPVVFFGRGHLVTDPGAVDAPLFLLGADGAGRDVAARLVYGARASLGIAGLAVLGAVFLGVLAGGMAGARGGWMEAALMRAADVVAVLPAIYIVITLRASMPLVLSTWLLAALLAALLALVGAPWIARGVRAIVAAERSATYVEAARASGASDWRILTRHLLPATRGFVGRQATLLLPSFVLAEATLSFIGLGLPDTVASWGTSLQEAANVQALAAFPWILAPAGAIFVVTLLVNLLVGKEWPGAAAVGTAVPRRTQTGSG